MPKRLHQADGSPYSANRLGGWSIGSNGLTSSGQNELLKQIGRQLQSDYQSVLNEPAPDRIKDLLKRLEAKTRSLDEDPLDEEQ
ncbi:NepR family anti-sigma factor [Microvirga solisilvae]|uniref:NepR family anti-sigma factor n=1 Tax=Microvirga solisilvae TaxID=2919498 RepID=UPI001FAEF457|nr:NepR family anti-sigma factor [Microvirga solisilvae]